MMTCRTFTLTSTSMRSFSKKLQGSWLCTNMKQPPARAAFFTTDCVRSILRTEVFNTFVENSVEKRLAIVLSDLLRGGSALCTGVSAGTFVADVRELAF